MTEYETQRTPGKTQSTQRIVNQDYVLCDLSAYFESVVVKSIFNKDPTGGVKNPDAGGYGRWFLISSSQNSLNDVPDPMLFPFGSVSLHSSVPSYDVQYPVEQVLFPEVGAVECSAQFGRQFGKG